MDPVDPILALRPFVPARDFDLSRRYYEALGFATTHRDDSIAMLKLGSFSFILQNFLREGGRRELHVADPRPRRRRLVEPGRSFEARRRFRRQASRVPHAAELGHEGRLHLRPVGRALAHSRSSVLTDNGQHGRSLCTREHAERRRRRLPSPGWRAAAPCRPPGLCNATPRRPERGCTSSLSRRSPAARSIPKQRPMCQHH